MPGFDLALLGTGRTVRRVTAKARTVPARKGTPKKGGGSYLFGVTVRIDKDFAPHVPGQQAVMARIGGMAGNLIRRRITGPNVDGDGHRLPPLSPVTTTEIEIDGQVADPASFDARGQAIIWKVRTGKSRTYKVGSTVRLQYRDGQWVEGKVTRKERPSRYGRAKSRAGKQNRRDGDLTGTMWGSLSATVQDKGVNKKFVRIFFAGSDAKKRHGQRMLESGRMSKGKAVRNNDKAWKLQHTGSRRFTLMGLAAGELATLRDYYVSRLKLFRRRSG